jgi:glycosyltransferase involved in cell wall biosynthesis
LHVDEEPYNLATFLAVRDLQRLDPLARPLFFSWQNLFKRYPPPFAWMERYVLARAAAAIAGSREVQRILQRKGFNKPMPIVPQFGVPESFTPATNRSTARCLVIGYAGRLVPEKGVTVLLQALALIEGPWELHVLGSGPLYDTLLSQARALNIHTHIQFAPWAASELMPRFYQSLDILVVPSLTRPNWKEQFGRVIMEAMACGVPVIGSNSGEIPNVIGDAGLVVSEGDPAALARALDMLMRNMGQRQQFARLGCARALALFSEQRVVDDTYALYQQLLQAPA